MNREGDGGVTEPAMEQAIRKEATCDECGAEVRYVVDGKWESLANLLSRTVAPRNVRKEIHHDRTCSSRRYEA